MQEMAIYFRSSKNYTRINCLCPFDTAQEPNLHALQTEGQKTSKMES